MNNTNDELEIDLLRLIQALWRKAWLIILVTAIFGIAALAGTALFVKPTYKAEALMYVNSSNISVGSTKVSISQSELNAAQTLVDTYIVIMNTRTTLEDVIEQTGVNYVRYLNITRVSQAAEQLSNGGKSITQIAMDCGFNSVRSFNRTFKEIMGCTPSDYISQKDLMHAAFFFRSSDQQQTTEEQNSTIVSLGS